MNPLKRQDGLTLLEVLAAITITGIIIGVAMMLLFQTQTGFTSITARSHALDQARYLTQHITREMRSYRNTISGTTVADDETLLILTRRQTMLSYYHNEINQTIYAELTDAEGKVHRFEMAERVSDVSVQFDEADSRIVLDITFELQPGKTLHYDTAIYSRSWDQE